MSDLRDYCPICGIEIPPGPDACSPACEVVFAWGNTDLTFKSKLHDQYRFLHDSILRLCEDRFNKN